MKSAKEILDPSQENVTKFHINKLSMLKTKGAMVWSGARWCEQDERNSKYFYHFERRNHSTKFITELRLPNKTAITEPQEILNEGVGGFYKELYSSTGVSPDDEQFNFLFDNPVLPKKSEVQKQSREGLLTKDECLSSLKQMAKDKSSGTEGLSAEFYLKE